MKYFEIHFFMDHVVCDHVILEERVNDCIFICNAETIKESLERLLNHLSKFTPFPSFMIGIKVMYRNGKITNLNYIHEIIYKNENLKEWYYC